VENFPNLTFSRKIFRFSSAKISDDPFLVINHKFRISPLFSLFQYISPISTKLFFSLLLKIPSPCFRQIYVFFKYFMCFSFPPTFTMIHLCITQCTYWTPLIKIMVPDAPFILKHTQSYIYLSNITRSRFCGITQKFVNYGPVPVPA